MLEQAFQDVYTKFKLHFYQNVFQRFATREATLTTVESFCMEGIMAMGEPTIAEFSRMMQISTPNAAYKIGSLVKKGYVEKIQSTTDRREYNLRPTQKYIDYYNISYSYRERGADAGTGPAQKERRISKNPPGRWPGGFFMYRYFCSLSTTWILPFFHST